MNAPKRYQIGQVLYALFPEKYALIPFRIAEENVVRTLNGGSVSYKAVYGPNSTLIELEAFAKKAIIYDDLNAAHTALLQQAKQTIDKVVSDAAAKAKAWFPNAVFAAPAQQPFQPGQEVQSIDFSALGDNDSTGTGEPMLELPDGTVARVKIGNGTAT